MRGEGASRRLGGRVRMDKPARIIDSSGCVTEIRIKDVSPTGARIEIPYGASLQRTFVVRTRQGGDDQHAEIVWRSGGEAGIRFISEPAPPPVQPAAQPAAPANRMSVADLRKMIRPR